MSESIYDPEERARQKQESRDRDDADIKSGKFTFYEVNQRNGAFAFPPGTIKIRWGSRVRVR